MAECALEPGLSAPVGKVPVGRHRTGGAEAQPSHDFSKIEAVRVKENGEFVEFGTRYNQNTPAQRVLIDTIFAKATSGKAVRLLGQCTQAVRAVERVAVPATAAAPIIADRSQAARDHLDEATNKFFQAITAVMPDCLKFKDTSRSVEKRWADLGEPDEPREDAGFALPMHKGTAGKWGRVGTLADVVRTRVASVCRLARVATTYEEQLLAHKWFERIRAASKVLPNEAAKATKAADAERQRQADNIRERLWDKSNRGKDCPDESEEPPPRDDNDDEQPW